MITSYPETRSTPGHSVPALPWLRLEEAAEYSRVSVRTIQRAILSGRLRARHVGRRVLFSPRDLDAFIRGD